MRRRGVTVLLGAILVALLAWGVVGISVPYVVLGPGPTVDTLGKENNKAVITVTGTPTTTSKGQLRLTTVSVQPDVHLLAAIQAWFDGEEAVEPRELIYPPDQTEQEVEQRNAEEFKSSQTSAETAALRALGYPVQVTVTKVVPGGAAEGTLRAGDVITSVDGQAVSLGSKLTGLIRAKPAGTALRIGYTRAGNAATATITSKAEKAGDPPRIGVEIEHRQPHPFTVKIELDKIGGPSAGLMFALGIVDLMKAEDLTGGKVIAGTGTIDDAGAVGAIGGIPQKMVGAKKAGANFFLTPADNCAEALNNRVDGLTLIKVATLDEALAALRTLREGGRPTECR